MNILNPKKLNLMKFFCFLPLILLILSSCSSDSDSPSENGFDYTGIWDLTELQMIIAQDINGDGQSSTNLVTELDCFWSNLNFNADGTYESSGMSFHMQLTSDTTVDITCTNVTENDGIWAEEENGIRVGGSSWTRVGNSIIIEYSDNEFPEFRKVVYNKN